MKEVSIIVAICIVCFWGIFQFAFWASEKTCIESYSNYKAEWGVFSGCRIEWQGKLTPVDIIREID